MWSSRGGEEGGGYCEGSIVLLMVMEAAGGHVRKRKEGSETKQKVKEGVY